MFDDLVLVVVFVVLAVEVVVEVVVVLERVLAKKKLSRLRRQIAIKRHARDRQTFIGNYLSTWLNHRLDVGRRLDTSYLQYPVHNYSASIAVFALSYRIISYDSYDTIDDSRAGTSSSGLFRHTP